MKKRNLKTLLSVGVISAMVLGGGVISKATITSKVVPLPTTSDYTYYTTYRNTNYSYIKVSLTDIYITSSLFSGNYTTARFALYTPSLKRISKEYTISKSSSYTTETIYEGYLSYASVYQGVRSIYGSVPLEAVVKTNNMK